MEQGRIIKGIGGFYYVQLDGGLVVECRARGRFRRDGKPPLVGDLVTILPQREGAALVDEILPRKNELVRPMAANVDRLLLVLSASAPPPDWLLADKLLIQAHCADPRPLSGDGRPVAQDGARPPYHAPRAARALWRRRSAGHAWIFAV